MEQAQRRNKLHPRTWDATLIDTVEDIVTRCKSEGANRKSYSGR
jgi:hypothetical protein